MISATKKFPTCWNLYLQTFLYIQNTLVDLKDIDMLMKQYEEEKGLMSQPQKMSISSFKLQNETLNTPLLLFYLELGLIRPKKSLRWVHCEKVFQQVCTINCSCVTARWREPNFQCSRWYNETASEQLPWLSNIGSQWTHSYEVLKQWENTLCYI